jgi:hypothetical protein
MITSRGRSKTLAILPRPLRRRLESILVGLAGHDARFEPPVRSKRR